MSHVPTPAVSGGETRLERALNLLSAFTMAMTVPQVLTIWVNQNAAGVSLISWSAYLLSAIVWLFYGLRRRNATIYLPCIGWIILDSAVVIGVIAHR